MECDVNGQSHDANVEILVAEVLRGPKRGGKVLAPKVTSVAFRGTL
jgi:hypothetical protein